MRFSNNPTTTTAEGGTAYKLSDKQELVRMCLTSFLSADFYHSEKSKVDAIALLSSTVDPVFCLKLAIFARNYGLRSVNHVLFVEAMKRMTGVKGCRNIISNALSKMVWRPDELSDIVGYFALSTGQNLNSIKLPNALKEAVRNMLGTFDAYKLAKYKGKSSDVNLYDIVNMSHAKSAHIDSLMKGTLESADTWEKELSENGNNKESWTRLIKKGKLGALGLVRNLRNILQSGVESSIVCEAVSKADFSKVFPFQGIQAIDAVATSGINDVKLSETVLGKVKESFKHISERYKGKIAIGVDVSRSMFGSPLSKMSSMDRAKVAVQYGMILKEICGNESVLYFWSSPKWMYAEGKNVNGNGVGIVNSDNFDVAMRFAKDMSNGTEPGHYLNEISNKEYDWNIMISDGEIMGEIKNVAKKGTIIWEIADSRDTCASGNGVVSFSGYDDTMWKVGSDIFHLGELEKEINSVSL